jgi:hypothetical protein
MKQKMKRKHPKAQTLRVSDIHISIRWRVANMEESIMYAEQAIPLCYHH